MVGKDVHINDRLKLHLKVYDGNFSSQGSPRSVADLRKGSGGPGGRGGPIRFGTKPWPAGPRRQKTAMKHCMGRVPLPLISWSGSASKGEYSKKILPNSCLNSFRAYCFGDEKPIAKRARSSDNDKIDATCNELLPAANYAFHVR